MSAKKRWVPPCFHTSTEAPEVAPEGSQYVAGQATRATTSFQAASPASFLTSVEAPRTVPEGGQ